MNKNKGSGSVAVAIVIGACILGTAFYLVQVDKRQSIERAEKASLAEKEADNERAELSQKQAQCESLSAGVKAKWNNVMGVTYDEFWKECMVTFIDGQTKEVQTSALRSMKSTN